ncbi:hypothetical protein ACFXKK_22495 [Streptomyces globisporus]
MTPPPSTVGELGRLLLPLAEEIDAAKMVPPGVLETVARSRALAATVPSE